MPVLSSIVTDPDRIAAAAAAATRNAASPVSTAGCQLQPGVVDLQVSYLLSIHRYVGRLIMKRHHY